ncbi:hypothetical protein DFJ73DRAFT_828738 [Zopfochytrium polystomum]|nr:hypothetical protein DFJ73DRAFT_828738 [Zopfochytrium polystomum]
MQSTISGWVSFGVGGSTMDTATMYVAYSNGNGGVTLSQRSSSGHSAPTVTPLQQFTQLSSPPSAVNATPGATITVTFSRSISSSASTKPISTTGATWYIFAFGNDKVSNAKSTKATFNEHIGYGTFTMDLSVPGITTGKAPGIDPEVLRNLHGFSMFLAWGVAPFVGIFAARYLKDRLGHNWYRVHVACMIGGPLVLSAVGMLTIEMEIPEGQPRFQTDSPHRYLGMLLVFGLAPAQIALGYYSNAMWKPDRKFIPWWDKLHWWVGRLAVLLGVIVIPLGFVLHGGETPIYVVYFFWIAAVIGAMVYGQIKYGVVHHVAGKESPSDETELFPTDSRD